ncbi:TetR family transcriptional regulator [Phycicoccus sp. CSK15P-2]|uniref:TetR/AcrR family transcriptional regulator n=1 Tax=Phycicoccus sp. CSK15P-2 TaxID=2807627 RepID=UPI00194EC4B7|nr:TetR family transcriptional regulator [Phycicoccus sp. CSK15P-2]MBM6405355.1 TetR family transcriptional regulator [Phycicoccus sp. CSK15P-2]
MTRKPTYVVTSLRDRKREETRHALVHAAYTIVRDGGVGDVTAEAVADRAGVSRRTFFNYFPSVESVITASVAEFFASLSDRLGERPEDEPVEVSLRAVVADPSDLDLVERVGVLAAAGEASPHAKGLILGELHAWLDWFEGWLRVRLGPDASELYVATVASALVGAGEAALRVWARHAVAGSEAPVPSFHAAFCETVRILGHPLLPDADAAVRPS